MIRYTKNYHKNGYTIMLVMIIVCSVVVKDCYANGNTAMVIYPEVSEPYQQVYTKIINGIKDKGILNVFLYLHSKSGNQEDFLYVYEKTKPDILIALGTQAYKFVKAQNIQGTPVIVSAVFEAAPEDNCVCLNVSPEILFKELSGLNPKVQRVFVVYNESSNGFMIQNAIRLSKKSGIKLIASKVNTSVEAAKEFRKILNSAGNRDAIWLPVDSIFPDSVMLPEILQTAWDRKFVVFSTSPAYVRRGGLFARYPDNFGLGMQIAKASISVLNDKSVVIHENTRYSKSAINIRTGRHLGLDINREKLNNFDVVFPSR